VDIHTLHEVLTITPDSKSITVKNLVTEEVYTDHYDKLIIATGARATIPPIKGVEEKHVFTLRNINDMNRIKAFINEEQPKSAVIIGTGFIGLEVCENLKKLGIDVTLLEKLPQITPGLDRDMAIHVQEYITKNGVTILTNVSATEITSRDVVLSDGRAIKADLVLISTGVRPNTELAEKAGIKLGTTGAIRVDARMQTNLPDIYSCGDCIEQFHIVTGKPVYRPLGSTANKTGRIAGDAITGGELEFRGILGTGIFKIFDMAVAQTGLSEREALDMGYEIAVCHNIKPDRPEYMGGKEMVIKGIADKLTGRLLGVQIVGYEGVDKRIDVFVTAITFKAKVEDLFHLDLAYAPPFSTTKDPVMYTGMILDNVIHNGRPLITAEKLNELMTSGKKYELIDARVSAQYSKAHVNSAINLPHSKLRDSLDDIDKDAVVITYCNKGVTGNAAQNIFINQGFTEVYNLSGGFKQYGKQKE
jgi:NADPH-dependent 2,4-dienoyl-CoA reductase/sulfur reductase-like enzyme/rhodanese-related sulfurtransferase